MFLLLIKFLYAIKFFVKIYINYFIYMTNPESKPFLKKGGGMLASSYNAKKDFSYKRKNDVYENQIKTEIYHHQYNENQNKYLEQDKEYKK